MPDAQQLFKEYKNDVYRLALSFTKSPAEAEDVCQTVFLKLLENPNITKGKEKAWLMQVTVNRCKSLLRSAWYKKTAPIDETVEAPEVQSDSVLPAVMSLEPNYRVVVYLFYYEGYSTEEIARLLRISRSAVTTRLSRARALLREILKEDI